MHSMRKSLDHQMRYHDNRKTDLLGIQSASTIKNGVFTNPQTKSNLNKRNREKNKFSATNNFGEEYPLSIRTFSTKKSELSLKALDHLKRESSISYLNKRSVADRHGAFYDESQNQEKNSTHLHSNLQRSLSKRQIPDIISGSGSDINPRRLTPSSGETFIDSNSEEGDDIQAHHRTAKGSHSFSNNRFDKNAINWQKQQKRVDRSSSRYSLQKHEDKSRSRRNRTENVLHREHVSYTTMIYIIYILI